MCHKNSTKVTRARYKYKNGTSKKIQEIQDSDGEKKNTKQTKKNHKHKNPKQIKTNTLMPMTKEVSQQRTSRLTCLQMRRTPFLKISLTEVF